MVECRATRLPKETRSRGSNRRRPSDPRTMAEGRPPLDARGAAEFAEVWIPGFSRRKPSQPQSPGTPWGHVQRPFGEIRVSPKKRERTRALHDADAHHTTAGTVSPARQEVSPTNVPWTHAEPRSSRRYGVPASAGGNRPSHKAPEPPGETSPGPSVKSVSLHESASGLAHSTMLTRCTQPRARSLPLGRRCPEPRFLGPTRSRGDRGGMESRLQPASFSFPHETGSLATPLRHDVNSPSPGSRFSQTLLLWKRQAGTFPRTLPALPPRLRPTAG
jgi:hypothetical protein